MKFGVAIFPTEYAISMTELAPVAEQLGFESLWVAEHSHIPTSRKTPWPGGAELPKLRVGPHADRPRPRAVLGRSDRDPLPGICPRLRNVAF